MERRDREPVRWRPPREPGNQTNRGRDGKLIRRKQSGKPWMEKKRRRTCKVETTRRSRKSA
jgi:hypothetical protein